MHGTLIELPRNKKSSDRVIDLLYERGGDGGPWGGMVHRAGPRGGGKKRSLALGVFVSEEKREQRKGHCMPAERIKRGWPAHCLSREKRKKGNNK